MKNLKKILITGIIFSLLPKAVFAYKTSCGNIKGIPEKIPQITSYIITIMQVAVTVILVIIGTIDLFKGITSSKEEEMKKGQQSFVKRLITAALVFFVVLIAKLLVGAIDNKNSGNVISCIDCFISNRCGEKYENEITNSSNLNSLEKITPQKNPNDSKVYKSSPTTTKSKKSENSDKTSKSSNELEQLLKKANIDESTLKNKNIKQLIVVNSSGTTANVLYFEKNGSDWENNKDLSSNGYVGSNGTTSSPSEGKSATPKGLYEIGDAFYQSTKPNTKLNSFKITNNTYWIDDVNSPLYNTKFVGNLDSGVSAEKMWEISSYKYGFVIKYNMNPVVKGKGSAIFFHVSHNSPTAGCVSVSESSLLAYLAKLDKSKNPYILII